MKVQDSYSNVVNNCNKKKRRYYCEKTYGFWIDSSNGWTCSECNHNSIKDGIVCPQCGADMINGL